MELIKNKVAASSLIVFDLEEYYQEGLRFQIDLAQWLDQGFVLREKDFRNKLKEHNWEQYKGSFVAIHCSSEAIVPAWAFALVASHLIPQAKKVIEGSISTLEHVLYEQLLASVNYTDYINASVIIKGCSKKPVPESAYTIALTYLQPVAKSIMYGEACSAVPLFKKK